MAAGALCILQQPGTMEALQEASIVHCSFTRDWFHPHNKGSELCTSLRACLHGLWWMVEDGDIYLHLTEHD
jgi:hypothetical protein